MSEKSKKTTSKKPTAKKPAVKKTTSKKSPPKKPTAAAKKPTAAAKKPTTAAKKPTTAAKKPTTAAKKPTTATKKPTTAAKKPTTATKKPTTAAKKSTTATTPKSRKLKTIKAKIVSYRRNNRLQTTNQAIAKILDDYNYKALIGKKFVLEFPDSEAIAKGVVTSTHGKSGSKQVRIRFDNAGMSAHALNLIGDIYI
jgi:ribosomal protein L35AE/L33A